MKDDEFEALLRDAARTYHRPPMQADPDATWRAIERALPMAGDEGPMSAELPELPGLALLGDAADPAPPRRTARPARPAWVRTWTHPLARMAAMLLVGVVVGRASATWQSPATSGTATVASSATRTGPGAASELQASTQEVATSRYLASTAALLIALPDELRERRRDAAFLSQADGLLLQTRLLLDSPAAADPTLRALLDDLEIVLAQLVRLDARRDPMGVDFLHEALEQRDVLPRLREAVADNAAD
jgi:hypothetical protein